MIIKDIKEISETEMSINGRIYRLVEEPEAEVSPLTLESIVEQVIKELHITKKEFESNNRSREFVEARYIYFYHAKRNTTASLVEIGSKVKTGSHSNVLHGIRQVEDIPSLLHKYNVVFHGAIPVTPIKTVKTATRATDIRHEPHTTILSLYGVPTYN
jgi:chromosomal replication initiation ATPase DnaA